MQCTECHANTTYDVHAAEFVCTECGVVAQARCMLDDDATYHHNFPSERCSLDDNFHKYAVLITDICTASLHLPQTVVDLACTMMKTIQSNYGKRMSHAKKIALCAVCTYHAASVTLNINAYRTGGLVMQSYSIGVSEYLEASKLYKDLSFHEPWYSDIQDVTKESHSRMITIFLKSLPHTVAPRVHHRDIIKHMTALHGLCAMHPQLATRKKGGVLAVTLYLVLEQLHHAGAMDTLVTRKELCKYCEVSVTTFTSIMKLMHGLSVSPT